jgi:hypothetical protein
LAFANIKSFSVVALQIALRYAVLRDGIRRIALHYAVAYAEGRCTAIFFSNFFGDFLATAFCKLQLILRSCEAELEQP